LPFYTFDADYKTPPAVGIELSDKGPYADIPGIAAFYDGCASLADAAKRACEAEGANFICLKLDSADPNGDDAPIEDSVAKAKEVADAVSLPLVIEGSGNLEKDGQLLPKLAEALEGKNVLLLSAKEENYKGIAVAAVTAYGQKIAGESAVDINLAKQLNVLIAQMGVGNDNLAMNLGTSAAGYGFEYLASTIERVKLAALTQNDEALQVPIITPVAADAWGVKETLVSEEDFPEWGAREDRGIQMEVCTASACLASGSDAVILRHPASVKTVSAMIKALA
jgi:acetyl-CoA decarbonylase/synthase complex subunit delta